MGRAYRADAAAAAQLAVALAVAVAPAVAAEQQRVALFEFALINTSLEPTRPDETARLAAIKEIATEQFARRG